MTFSGCTRLVQFLQALVLSFVLVGFSISIASAQTLSPSQPGAHVYLLRGFANVFSLGMDEIAAKLQRHGIHTTVDNYLAWPNKPRLSTTADGRGRLSWSGTRQARQQSLAWPHA